MHIKMKMHLFLAAALALAGCAHQPPPAPITATVAYYGPQYDLEKGRSHMMVFSSSKTPVPSHRLQGGIGRAAICNEERTSCRHALTVDVLALYATRLQDGRIRVYGTMHSEMGREKAVVSEGLMHHWSNSGALPADIPLIGEESRDVPFERVVSAGQAIEVPGYIGAKFVVSIN